MTLFKSFARTKCLSVESRDIHNHLLPGVDDGFQKAEDSLDAILTMSQNGCRELVFTPHINPDVYPEMNEDVIRKVFKDFSARIPAEWDIKTSLAAEYMVVNNFEQRVSSAPESLLHYEDGSILIEMSYYYRSRNLEETVFNLGLAGYKPIIAHPERYGYMVDCLSDFDKLQEMGCRFQMNLMSAGGYYGSASVEIMKYLLSRNMYSFKATDLHTKNQLDRILSVKPVRQIRKYF